MHFIWTDFKYIDKNTVVPGCYVNGKNMLNISGTNFEERVLTQKKIVEKIQKVVENDW